MTSPVLFSTGASATSSGVRNLVEFKAGKMEMRDKMVHPIKRQGLVYLRQSAEDSLVHLCWKDRQTGVVEDDLILFPDDCEFKRVRECATGRVFVLKMKSSGRKMFFWMQESQSDRDDEFCKKINEMLSNPPRAGSEMGNSSERDLQALFGNMTQEQVAQILSSNGVNLASLLGSAGRSPSSNSGASTAGTTNTAPTSASSVVSHSPSATAASRSENTIGMNDFRALLTGALMEGNGFDPDALMAASRGEMDASSQSRDHQRIPIIDLSTAMNSDSLAHLLDDDDFLKQVEPFLPPIIQESEAGQTSLSASERRTHFADATRSSQFRSSLSQFCVALQSGQLGPLMSQFGLNQACVDAANLGNLEAFVRALDSQFGAASSQPASSQQAQPPSDTKDKKQ